LGAFILGRRADKTGNPLRLYAYLEFGVAIVAALSPLLVALVRLFYIRLGGTAALGTVGGTAIRLCLSVVVLGVPTFLMGGTLPAVTRALESVRDVHRRSLGVMYGMNTLGAVVGTLLATFLALEMLGTRVTLWSAVALNLIVAGAAFFLSRRPADSEPEPAQSRQKRSSRKKRDPAPVEDTDTPAWLILIAAGVVGFVFLLMELVWSRMLTPLLGGSSYTFGLILAVALLGIGIGGLGYSVLRPRPTALNFAFTCALEGLFIALPYALGDRLALFALSERQGATSFGVVVWGWLLVTAVVVLPAAIVSGYQFPVLVGLLGRGRERVGADVGRAYAANSFGAILGSLAGGFGLMPALTAPGVWRVSVYLLILLAALIVTDAVMRSGRWGRAAWAIVPAIIAIGCFQARGPTGFWRHSPIGAGRMKLALDDHNAVQRALNTRRLATLWDTDGIESAVSLDRANGLSFYLNGKSDGNAIGDAATQVMLGLLGTALHPNPRRVLVIGLGTGETAGWLAQIPSVERVDVYELEPALLRVAEACAAANHNALKNPKVRVVLGDARELLLTTSEKYDVIVSEPSNPYRAGVASLFTREFYEGVAARLNSSGVFVQWVQAYEVKADAIRSIIATLQAVFPAVETWELMLNKDLGFVASKNALVHDVARTRARMQTEPYRTALPLVLGVDGAEGFYTGALGNAAFASEFRRTGIAPVNTDDRTYLEFAFARSVGDTVNDAPGQMRRVAALHGHERPEFVNGSLDWSTVEEDRVVRAIAEMGAVPLVRSNDAAVNARQAARYAYSKGDLAQTRSFWMSQLSRPSSLGDIRMIAESYAAAADSSALEYIESLRVVEPVEAELLLALFSDRTNNPPAVVDHLIEGFRIYRTHPWANRALIERAFDAVGGTVNREPGAAERLFAAMSEPFAVRALDINRLETLALIGFLPGSARCVQGLAALEPDVPWEEVILRGRESCYASTGNPLAARARADLEKFTAAR
jgi:spermidine synthase